jgi:signal transduction histidine kinase
METDGAKLANGVASSKISDRWNIWGSFATKSRALFLLLLSLAVFPALYAVGQAQIALHAEEKANGAHHILELYLELSEVGHAIEKQLALAGSLDNPDGRKLLARKTSIALQLRKGIAAEIVMRGDGGMAEEGEELDHTDKVLAAIDATYSGGVGSSWHRLIDEAITHERAEMDEIDRQEKYALESTIWVLTISAAIVFTLFIGALVWLDRSIGIPLARLRQVTNRVADGNRNVRLAKMRDAEFNILAENFNRMAQTLDTRRTKMEDDAAQLEKLVSTRTTELRAANAELLGVSETRKKFLTDISHELRTPLAIIRGDAEVTLRGDEKPIEEYRSALLRITGQISGLTRLVDDLLYVARNEDGAPTVKLRPVELFSIVDQAANSMRPMLQDVDGHLTVTSDIDVARIAGDEQRLLQLAYILLDNAVQYSDGAPDILVQLLHATDGFMLRVEDKGTGIAANDLSTVFERFRRGKQGVIKNDAGLGIGLPMAKAIVEAHGGSISIDSNLGDGTTVSVFLPAAQKLKVVNEHIGG